MPNHVIHEIEINSPNIEKLKEIGRYIKSKESKFDFNKIIPLPQELEGTASPATIIKDKDFPKELRKYKKRKNNFGGRPISESESKELIQKYGYDNWYDWNIENWGTKWNAYDIKIFQNTIEFQTAWSTPEPVIQKLSEKFPETTFTIKYADEDMGSNCGIYEYKNGQMIHNQIENKIFAENLWGWESDPEEETNLDGLEEI